MSFAKEFDDAFDGLRERSTRLAYQLLGEYDAAQEVAGEALARLFEHWELLAQDLDHATAWTLRVTRNLAIDALRRRARESDLAQTDLGQLDAGSEILLRIAVADALRQLPQRQRQVIELRYLRDLSQTEVARMLGVRPGTVAIHTSRAAARLRELLADEPRHHHNLGKEFRMGITSIDQAAALVGTDEHIQARITSRGKGYFDADIGIPAVYRGRGQRRPQWTSPAEFVGQDVDCVIIDIDAEHRPLITDALFGDAATEFAAVQQRVAALPIGLRIAGRVTHVLPFGAFVDIGGLRGLVHTSLLDGAPMAGQRLDVEVVDTDARLARVSLRPAD